MKRIITVFILIATSPLGRMGGAFAQEGVIFPSLIGETLEGNTKTIPTDTKGKYTVLGLAYSKKAEDDLRSWFQPAYDKFIAKTGMFDDEFDVHTFFIPMFTGAAKGLMKASMKKIQDGHNKALFPHVLYYKGDLKTYSEPLKMDNKELPYFFVLDKEGKIVYHTSGRYSDEKMEKIEEFILE